MGKHQTRDALELYGGSSDHIAISVFTLGDTPICHNSDEVQLTICAFFQTPVFHTLAYYCRPVCPLVLKIAVEQRTYTPYNISKAQLKRLRNKTVGYIFPLSFFVEVHGSGVCVAAHRWGAVAVARRQTR